MRPLRESLRARQVPGFDFLRVPFQERRRTPVAGVWKDSNDQRETFVNVYSKSLQVSYVENKKTYMVRKEIINKLYNEGCKS